MIDKVNNILLVGVGGQGIIRASDILSVVLMNAGYDVKKSEVHGMAQRGGCVSSHVRYGKKVYSPLTRKGDVDILVSFEKMETLRYLEQLRPDARVIINDTEIYPPAVNLGDAVYPNNVIETVEEYFDRVVSIDASNMALLEGNPRMANTIMLGVLSTYLDVKLKVWDEVLRETFPPRIAEQNLSAFSKARG